MCGKEEIEKVVELLEKKYNFYLRLRENMVSLKQCIVDGETQEMEGLFHKRDRHIRKINEIDKQISKKQELLSGFIRDNENKDGYRIRRKLEKLRGVIEEISRIQEDCQSSGRSQMVILKQEISSVRKQIHAFKSYIPHAPPHSRFVDIVR